MEAGTVVFLSMAVIGALTVASLMLDRKDAISLILLFGFVGSVLVNNAIEDGHERLVWLIYPILAVCLLAGAFMIRKQLQSLDRVHGPAP